MPHVHDVLCVGRCAVPATLLSYVLGLPEDWLSRLSGTIQWYVSISAKQPWGISAAGLVVGLCHSANAAHGSPQCCLAVCSSSSGTHRFVCWSLSLSSSFAFRAQSDRQMPGWCAEQQQLWIRGPPGENDSPGVAPQTLGGSLWAHNNVLLVWSACTGCNLCPRWFVVSAAKSIYIHENLRWWFVSL